MPQCHRTIDMGRHYAFLPISRLGLLKLTFGLCICWTTLRPFIFVLFQATEALRFHSLDLPVVGTPDLVPRDRTGSVVSVWQQATTKPCSLQNGNFASFLIPSEPDHAISSMLVASIEDSSLLHDVCDEPTSQVRIFVKCPHWELQALNTKGLAKQNGGDEFYITYTDQAHETKHQSVNDSSTLRKRTHPTAVAKLEDLKNGRYLVKFISSPLNHRHHRLVGRGTITVAFQYTCGIGRMAPSAKGHWKTGADTVVEHSRAVPVLPPISPFRPSFLALNGIIDDAGVGATSTSNNRNYRPANPGFLAFGDSLMQQFVKPLKEIELPNIGMPLNSTTVGEWIQLFQRRMDPRLRLLIQSLATDEIGKKTKVVLIVGSSTWDILEPQEKGFDDHKAALEKLLTYFRQAYPETVQLVWKSPTALHVHVPKIEHTRGLQKRASTAMDIRLKYMSSSRSYQLYELQAAVCRALQVPFLDVFEASYLSADHTMPGDGRHYSEEFNSMTMTWLLRRNPVEDLWYRYYHRGSKKSSRILIGQHCESWVDVVSAVIVAMVTNRRLVWQPKAECPILSRLQFPQESDQAETNKTIVSKRTRLLDQRIHFPLTLDSLKEEGWISSNEASASNRLAKDAFDEGSAFIYGMILYELLTLPSLEDISFNRKPLPSDLSLVFAVHDPSSESDIGNCIRGLRKHAADTYGLALIERLSCQVIFSTHSDAEKWHEVLHRDHKCTAIAAETADIMHMVDGNSWFHATTVARMAHDGFVSPCNTPTDSLFHSLVQYIRTQDARERGSLPLADVQKCCV